MLGFGEEFADDSRTFEEECLAVERSLRMDGGCERPSPHSDGNPDCVVISDDENCHLDSRRLGVDEKRINFRPSPNFKNMRKFLKYKKDLESSSQSPPNTSSDETPPNNISESPPNTNQQKEKQSPVKPPIQPPLPLDPPPPYTTPIIPIPLKQEIIDDEYPDSGRESPNLSAALSTSQTEPSPEVHFEKKEEPDTPDSTSTEICRDFLRGTCVRGENCRYAHKFDRSQLSNVYTFCKNYQNVRCTYPFCKYVHATVFEEQEFYRTGVLPPHVMNHHTPNTPIYLMPPPPPPPPPPETPPKPLNTPLVTSPLQAQTAYNQITSYVKPDTKAADGFKKNWTGKSLSTPPRDFDNKENNTKECKNCDTMEIRLQYNQQKIEDLKRSSLDLKKKGNLLSMKTNALCTVLFTVLKSHASTAEGMSALTAILNNCGEKEKALLQNILQSHRGPFCNTM